MHLNVVPETLRTWTLVWTVDWTETTLGFETFAAWLCSRIISRTLSVRSPPLGLYEVPALISAANAWLGVYSELQWMCDVEPLHSRLVAVW